MGVCKKQDFDLLFIEFWNVFSFYHVTLSQKIDLNISSLAGMA